MPPLFTITQANKSYGDIPALIDAYMTLQPGEVHALIGENGAGKSTLIKIMAGVVSPDSAKFTLRGNPIRINTPQDALNHGMRFIHQELSFVPELSAAENIFLGQPYPQRLGLLVDWNELHRRAEQVLQTIGIDHVDPRTTMAHLSTGDQMLVRIASAFAGDDAFLRGKDRVPKVYVMDEPTAALTGSEVTMLFQVIRRLQALNDAVLYVSHRLSEIFEIADTTTVMRNGEVVAVQPTAELTHDDMIHLMTGRELENMYPGRQTALSEEPLLSVENLHTDTVKNIDFTLRGGEILGITGLRASGQTDLLRALVGTDAATGGHITLDGEILPDSTAARWEAGVTYVPRERRSEGLVMSRSIRDNMVLPHLRQLARGGVFVDRSAERDLSRTYADSTRLKAAGVEQTVRELSGGNQQKVVFARALARDPRVLLLDEPTRGVDVGAKFDIYTLIREISSNGTGIVMSSTDLPELIGMCDRILVMQAGEIIDSTPTEGLTESDLLTLCYGKREEEL